MSLKPQLPLEMPGGCLCGAIRYTITIPEGAQWPLSRNSTCQCTQCRKFTGCLIAQDLSLPTSWISPPLTSFSTFKTYDSSPIAYRSFCSTCGSCIAFNYKAKPEKTELFLGTVDEDVLCGKKVEETGKRQGGVGLELGKAQRHIYMENAIPNLTDGSANYLEGRKYATDDTSEAYE